MSHIGMKIHSTKAQKITLQECVGRKHMKERNKSYSVASIVRAKPSFFMGLGEVPEDENNSVGDQNRRGVCEETGLEVTHCV